MVLLHRDAKEVVWVVVTRVIGIWVGGEGAFDDGGGHIHVHLASSVASR